MNKVIIIIDDAISRLERREADVKNLDMELSVDIKATLDFCSFTEEGDIIFDESFNKYQVRILFIHTSYNDPNFPEGKVSALRNAMKPCLVVGLSGQTRTNLSVPKVSYSNFEIGFLDFLTVFKKYDEIMLSIFTSPKTWSVDLARQYFYELDSCIDAGDDVNVLINSRQFCGLLKLSDRTSLKIEKNLDHDSFLKLCRSLVETVK